MDCAGVISFVSGMLSHLLFPCMPRHLDERKNGRRLLNFEPLNPAGGRNPREVAILEEKYIFVHINSR